MNDAEKKYKAIIWKPNSDKPGLRVSVVAASSKEAKELLEKQYGPGTVFDLHNEDEANKLR